MDARDLDMLGMNLAEVGTDMISRRAALGCFHDWIDKHGDIHTPDEMPEYREIEALPSAQPMRKKGKWQWSEDMMCFICSECKSGWKEQPTLMGKPLYEWCPVCGSYNGGDKDENQNH